jgi:hypothetical protein
VDKVGLFCASVHEMRFHFADSLYYHIRSMSQKSTCCDFFFS